MSVANIEPTTRDWIRNPSDERAAENGCRFDEERAQFAVDWIEGYCRLYEGEHAGQPLILHDDWQRECTMRIFGWVRWSDHWKREIRRFRKASIYIAKKTRRRRRLRHGRCTCYVATANQGKRCS